MTVELNGRPAELPAGATVVDAIEAAGAAPNGRGVAAAVDGEVVRRGDWTHTSLRDGQKVEVVMAVQGG
jgi:sulfur carrier protein